MTIIRVVAGAIIADGQLLAARRGPGMSLAGLWELPGGKVEPGEGDRAALARELHEELAVQVQVGAHLAESLHRYPSKTVRLIAYRCTLIAGTPRLSEHAELRWLTAGALQSVAWAPADVPLLEAVGAALALQAAPRARPW